MATLNAFIEPVKYNLRYHEIINMRHRLPYQTFFLTIATCFLYFVEACQRPSKDFTSWGIYRGGEGSNAYSSLDQINTANVRGLKVAWVYHASDSGSRNRQETNPIIVGNILYGISARLEVFALDASTGRQHWKFNPFSRTRGGGWCRGLTYWKNGEDERIFLFAANRLLAINAKTGQQIMNFGDSGFVDLNDALRNAPVPGRREDVGNTSPGIIYKDLLIMGSSVSEDYESSPGHIRAYDVRTGKLKWTFHTVPEPGDFGYDTWSKDSYKTIGGCNAWSGLSLDSKRGIVFAATGAPAFDFHGGERKGQNLFGNCVIALDAATGKHIWHFQVSHHDLWDYDLPAAPNLVTIKKENKIIDAVAQVTKQGYIFLFDRATGKPLFPVDEKPVPASTMPGEQTWPTQPVPIKPLPLCRQAFDENTITDVSPEAHEFILNEVKKYQWGDIYRPPTANGIIQMPGFRGGAEWSGGCVDMSTGIMYVGINDIPNIVELMPRATGNDNQLAAISVFKAGEILYQKNCSVCHGADRSGNNSFPSLLHIRNRLTSGDVKIILQKPRGMMPSFNTLPQSEKDAITAYLFNIQKDKLYRSSKPDGSIARDDPASAGRYRLKGYIQLKDQNGYPGVKPPWGTLNAIDLNSGDLIWKRPLGEYPELAAKGHPGTGTQLFGGGVVTAGGLIFIGASQDEKFRAIDKNSGKTLWEYRLPYGGYATPATYEADGKQYVVIAAGGGGFQNTKSGDDYIAFALPGR